MAMNNKKTLFLFFCILSFVAVSCATNSTLEAMLKQQSEDSFNENRKAYDPNPDKLTDEFNEQVDE